MACNHRDCPVSPVDYYVKKQVLFDTINVMMAAKRKEGMHNVEDEFGSLVRVHPCYEEVDVHIYDCLKEVRNFFLKVTKGKTDITE